MKHITILAYDGCWAMSVMTVKDVLTIATLLQTHLGQSKSYHSEIVSYDGKAINTASDVVILADSAISQIKHTDLVVIPPIEGSKLGKGTVGQQVLIDWIKEQNDKGIPIIALTTGVFLLAKAGLLTNKLTATHWAFLSHFRRNYPDCRFITHGSYTCSGNLYSTGSLNGCMDALLHHIALDKGEHFAQLCAAHSLQVPPEQLNPLLPGRRNHEDDKVVQVQDWIEAHHNQPLLIGELASQFGFSERNLKRRFKLATDLSPLHYVQLVRLEKAKKLLIATSQSINDIANSVGYENCSFFIRLFKKQLGVTPSQWRKPSAYTP